MKIRTIIHRTICWYLRRSGGAFHTYPYGKDGRYVVIMTDEKYGWYNNNLTDTLPSESDAARCSHSKKKVVGNTVIGMGSVTVYWCPECGALKKTMTNWENKDYPWEIPS